LCGETFNDLVDDAGRGVGLIVKTEGISVYSRLAFLDSLLCGLEMFLEVGPSFIGFGFIMPFANVAGENGGPSNGDDANIN
jgi:hypothetical protein